LNRRDFISKTLIAIGTLSVFDACTADRKVQKPRLSDVGVLLIKDLTADAAGDLHARNVVTALAEASPRRLYQVLVSINNTAFERFGRNYNEIGAEDRHSIVSDIYKENGAARQLCSSMVQVYYNYPYRWKIIGYKPARHQEYGIEDPEFDTYFSQPLIMEV
jgi:hypothetical protein